MHGSPKPYIGAIIILIRGQSLSAVEISILIEENAAFAFCCATVCAIHVCYLIRSCRAENILSYTVALFSASLCMDHLQASNHNDNACMHNNKPRLGRGSQGDVVMRFKFETFLLFHKSNAKTTYMI